MALGKQRKVTQSSRISFKGVAIFCTNTFITVRGAQFSFGPSFFGNQFVIYNCDIGRELTFSVNCLMGPRYSSRTANSNFSSSEIPIEQKVNTTQNLNIGNDFKLGTNVVMLPGVTIGDHVLVESGSGVAKNLNDHSAGVHNLAKGIKKDNRN